MADAMTPAERGTYDGLLALIREELGVVNAMKSLGLTDEQLDAAAGAVASEVDFGFTYAWRPNRGPNYKPSN